MAREKKKRTPRKRIPDKVLIDALKRTRGLIRLAAKLVPCSPRTIQKRVKESPKVLKALEDQRELQLDRTELKLFEAIDAGRPWAICFYLKCVGKERGYIEKQQVEHSGETVTKLYEVGTPVDEV